MNSRENKGKEEKRVPWLCLDFLVGVEFILELYDEK